MVKAADCELLVKNRRQLCKLDQAALKHLLDTCGQTNIPPTLEQHEERRGDLQRSGISRQKEPDKLFFGSVLGR